MLVGAIIGSGWWTSAVAIALLNVVAAGAVAWYALRIHRARPGPKPRSAGPHDSASSMPIDPEEVRALLNRLRELAATTAHDVGEHSHRVETVTRELAASSAQGEAPLRASLLAAAQQILEANRQLQAELAHAKAELHEHAKRIEVHMAEARTDALAGIANRRAFDEELARRYAAWQRQGAPLSLFLIDVDHFKKLNDTYGHQAGDEVLRGIGRVLAANVRDMDFVARYGGEEFAFILPGTRLEDAKSAAERIRTAVAAETFRVEAKDLKVTVSLGVAELRPGDTVASLLQRADLALYAAKKGGRDCTYYHDGVACLPVDPKAVSARAAVGRVVHQQLIEADLASWSTDRRRQGRHRFGRVQSIAPFVNGQFPSPDMFREVQCRDLTAGGFSFWLPAPPDFSSMVVALGSDGAVKYLTAEVAHTTKVERDGNVVFIVGSRFTGRIEPNGTLSPK